MKCSQKIYIISETGTDTLEKYHFCFDISDLLCTCSEHFEINDNLQTIQIGFTTLNGEFLFLEF